MKIYLRYPPPKSSSSGGGLTIASLEFFQCYYFVLDSINLSFLSGRLFHVFVEEWFRVVIAVEKKRIVGTPLHRPVVLP